MKAQKSSGPDGQFNGNIAILCPGCDEMHLLNVIPANGRPAWSFNDDLEKPTFSPSLLVRTGHFVTGKTESECENCIECKAEGVETTCEQCHSFITDGNIQFLADSTHALAGQTVPLGDFINGKSGS